MESIFVNLITVAADTSDISLTINLLKASFVFQSALLILV